MFADDGAFKSGYVIPNSLRFRSSASARLSRTYSAGPSNSGRVMTFSFWVKRGSLGAVQALFSGYDGSSGVAFSINFLASDQLQVQCGGVSSAAVPTTALFRDPSAHYHYVVAIDTTQATAANRVIITKNGEVQTLSAPTYPAQNLSIFFTLANANNRIGCAYDGASQFFDGLLSDINFIDGQALDASYFGQFDINGVWTPKKFTGTYGANGFYLPFNDGSSLTALGYDKSVRTTQSAYSFTETFATYSGWTTSSIAGTTGSSIGVSGGALVPTSYGTGSGWHGPSATKTLSNLSDFDVTFNNVVIGNTSGDIHAVYLKIGTAIDPSYFTWCFVDAWNDNDPLVTSQVLIGGSSVQSTTMATFTGDVRLVRSGSTLTYYRGGTLIGSYSCAASLATTVSIEFWEYQTYATPTQSVDGVTITGTANSVISNDWTPTNISLTAGPTYDWMVDTPSNNYAVMSIADIFWKNPGVTCSNGNLTGSAGAGWIGHLGNFPMSSGKWYFEVTLAAGHNIVGLQNLNGRTADTTGYPYGDVRGVSFQSDTYGSVAGDVFAVSFDADAGTGSFYRNGTSVGTFSGCTQGPYFASVSYDITTQHINFGQRPFSYTPPTGFRALCTANLPAMPIPKGKEHVQFVPYVGTGGQKPVAVSGASPYVNRYSPAAVAAAGKSLRLRSSATAYLSRTPASAGSSQKFTWAAWVKRGSLGSEQLLLSVQQTSVADDRLEFTSSDTFGMYFNNGSITPYSYTTQVFRDPSAWYHLVVAVDTTQATAANRILLYVNGAVVTATTGNLPAQNYTITGLNTAKAHNIARRTPGDMYFDGYIAEQYFIDGQQLDASYFGQADSRDGPWIPKTYTGTYGTNGFYLPFSNTSSLATLTADSSGNSNNWTANNISLTPGITYDSMSDYPTNSYSLLNPLEQNGTTESDANLRMTAGNATTNNVYGSLRFPTSGKFYYEFKNSNGSDANNGLWFGLTADNVPPSTTVTSAARSVLYASSAANLYINGSSVGVTGLTTFNSAHTYLVAVDMDNLKAWVGYYNGSSTVWFNSTGGTTGDPATGSNPTFTLSGANTYAPICGMQGVGGWFQYANFGQRGFDLTPPTGFKALCTANLPNVNLFYFQPDLVMIKDRITANAPAITNSVAGAGSQLNSASTAAETTTTQATGSFFRGGVMVGNDVTTGTLNDTYIASLWKAGGPAVLNNSGSIPSMVSANVTAGFSIVTYQGTGANATVGHGLGQAPAFIIFKQRNGTLGNWGVYHKSLGPTQSISFNLTAAAGASAAFYNNTAPTSTVFTIGTSNDVNTSSAYYYQALCWAEISGYSKFGQYAGNGSSDGPFVYCGFRPRYVLLKSSSGASNWFYYDTARETYNKMSASLYTNTSIVEDTSGNIAIDFLSNGFKLRAAAGQGSNESATYIFAAFAENPFGGMNVAPVTAR